jgi:hypothetical protein
VKAKHKIVEDTMTWTREAMHGIPPPPRNCHSMTQIKDRMYMLGGYATGQMLSELMVRILYHIYNYNERCSRYHSSNQ